MRPYTRGNNMFEVEETHFNTSPVSSQNDGLSSSYKSSLPRCAVVNFTKDGHLIKWTPRARENTGGMAARVRDFDDAFQLEELSSRTFAFSNPRLPVPDTKVPPAPKEEISKPAFDLSTALTQAALHGNLSINPPKLSRRKKLMKFLFRRQRKTLHRQENKDDDDTSIFLSGIASEDRTEHVACGGKLFTGRSLEERPRPKGMNTGGSSEDSSNRGGMQQQRRSERMLSEPMYYQGDGHLQLYDADEHQVRSRGFGGLFKKEQQLQLIDPDLIAHAALNNRDSSLRSWMCWKPESDAKFHNHPGNPRPFRASVDQYIQFMDEF